MSDVMAFVELKFTLEKWWKGKFDVSSNDVKRGTAVPFFNCYIQNTVDGKFALRIQ